MQSNIVALPVDDAAAWRDRLAERGVLVSVLSARTGRLVTHADVSEPEIDEALARIAQACIVQAGPVPV